MEKAPMNDDEEEVELLQVPNMMMNNNIGSTSSSSHHLHNTNSFQFQDHPYSSSSPKPSFFSKIPILTPQKVTRYKECLKNHAAAMGMTATDGCGEFMPGTSPESTLICSACGCHRNFHRQETVIPSPPSSYPQPYPNPKPSCTCHHNNINAAKINNNETNYNNSNNHNNLGHAQQKVINLGPPGFDHMIRAQPNNTHDQNMGARPRMKRSRTKLSREQKERMARFADKIGWRLQKQDVELLQEFCREIGVGTSVFKVWMHNNKQTRVRDSKNNNRDTILINKP